MNPMRNRALSLALLLTLAATSQAFAGDATVYATAGGKKYHTKNCRLKHGSTGMKLAAAKKKGLAPCAVCKPPKA